MRPILPLLLVSAAFGQAPKTFPLNTIDGLTAHLVKISPAEHSGRKCIRIVEDGNPPNGQAYAVVDGINLAEGVIEFEVASRPSNAAGEGARGFAGLAFRMQPDGKADETFYLRPTNGRAEDQVRRNHSVQYTAEPDYPWPRLRKEFPEKFEAYVDLQPGVWTKVRVVLDGAKARFFVHGNEQPTLIVNVADLKLTPKSGGLALWIGPGTEAFFANLKVTAKN